MLISLLNVPRIHPEVCMAFSSWYCKSKSEGQKNKWVKLLKLGRETTASGEDYGKLETSCLSDAFAQLQPIVASTSDFQIQWESQISIWISWFLKVTERTKYTSRQCLLMQRNILLNFLLCKPHSELWLALELGQEESQKGKQIGRRKAWEQKSSPTTFVSDAFACHISGLWVGDKHMQKPHLILE